MPHSIFKQHPKIFIDWHPTLNGNINPSKARRTSRKKYWWRCHSKKCGCNWKATIYARLHMGDTCPKCKERKKNRYVDDFKEVQRILKKIKMLQAKTEKHLDIFVDDKSSTYKKTKNSVFIRRNIIEINRLGVELRKIILAHKKKMITYKKELETIKKTKK